MHVCLNDEYAVLLVQVWTYERPIVNIVVRNASTWSGTGDDDRSVADCPLTHPSLLSCGLHSINDDTDSVFINGSGRCWAQNGNNINGEGVVASALCVDDAFSCWYPQGQDSSTSCAFGDGILVSCAGHNKHGQVRGSFIGASVWLPGQDIEITSESECVALPTSLSSSANCRIWSVFFSPTLML